MSATPLPQSSYLIPLGMIGPLLLFAGSTTLSTSTSTSALLAPALPARVPSEPRARTGATHWVFEDKPATPAQTPPAPAEPAVKTAAETPCPAASKPSAEPAKHAVEELRSSRGSLLQGSILSEIAGSTPTSDAHEFEEAMARVASQAAGTEPPTAALIANPYYEVESPEAVPSPAHERVYDTARQLEAIAWELEAAEEYPRADRLRKLAGDIREQARQLRSSSENR